MSRQDRRKRRDKKRAQAVERTVAEMRRKGDARSTKKVAPHFDGRRSKALARDYDRNIAPAVEKMSLAQQVELVRGVRAPMGVKRAGILKDLPTDIRRMSQGGKTVDEIKAYFWGCEAFRQLWTDFGLDEARLDRMIKEAT